MTTFHCTKLCSGDCCAPLSWALRMLNSATMGQTYLDLANGGKPIEPGHDAKYFALRAAIDPATLAELMTTGLRARGFCIYGKAAINGHIMVSFDDETRHRTTTDKLAVSRTKLLAIMATPPDESSREACEQIVRGET